MSDLNFVTEEGKIYKFKDCRVSSIGSHSWIVKFRGSTFIFTEKPNRVTLQIVRVLFSYLEVKYRDETLVKGDLKKLIGQTFSLDLPIVKPPITIESICDEKGLRIRNFYYDKITKEIVIKTEET